MRMYYLVTFIYCCLTFSVHAQSIPSFKGRVVDAVSQQPITGVTISNKTGKVLSISSDSGYFTLKLKTLQDSVVFHAVGYLRMAVRLKADDSLLFIRLQPSGDVLTEVFVSTGFQKLPRERATGSFDFIDNKLINRTVSSDFLSRIENLTPGLLINHGDAASTDRFLIRGRSTIYSNAQPLIVLDNFPYDGDLASINPNTIENISILKDAAAASIWGARAANGVIVITTRQGKSVQPRVELIVNVSYKPKPDLFNVHSISPADFVEAEKNLFASGYYETEEYYNSINYGHAPFTPVVELLRAERDGLVTPADAQAKIEAYKKHDVRNDISKYLYQSSLNQQYAANLSGRAGGLNYFMSAGYDRNLLSLTGQHNGRLTLLSHNSLKVNRWLSMDAGIQYTQGQQQLNGNQSYQFISNASKYFYPYAQFTSADGSPAYLDLYYNKQFSDTAGNGLLMNWKYSPIRDLHEQQYQITTRDFMANTGLSFTITPFLSADIKYRYEYQIVSTYNLYTDSSFYVRNLINNFSQVDYSTGTVNYPIPKGGILYNAVSETFSHQGRAQLNFHETWNRHNVSAIAGYEIKNLRTKSANSGYQYGYDASIAQINNTIDYTSYYPQYSNAYVTSRIGSGSTVAATTDNYLSWYANAAWTLNDRYIISGSYRKDEANLFGVATNLRGNPLWSAGAAWLLHNESFFHTPWISSLKLRGTIGYSGNVSRAVSAVSTISYYPSAGSTPLAFANILNPPNDKLRWEKVRMINIGTDFELLKGRINGTIEYYWKKAEDLLGAAPVDPTLGIAGINYPSFFGNLASMKGNGLDMQINSRNLEGKISWSTSINFSYTTSRVTRYLMPVASSAAPYINNSITPLVGKPLFELFSYPWMGLDPTNGAPRGILNGKASSDYNSIFNNTPLDSITDNGNRQPLLYGALRNTITAGNFTLSFTLSYKFKYYLRRPSLDYQSFAYWTAHADYAKRWQKPGDERNTNVPSFVYPIDPQRESFYTNASILVEKADNIRLEDINLSYDLDRSGYKKLPFAHVRMFVLVTNAGAIWKANKAGIDPYYNNIPLDKPIYSTGIQLSL
ncbi:MAG: SusC/RagA family TonB-linked outer membrane protein [Agriterribacter sp.]